jgi:hypothetical protein
MEPAVGARHVEADVLSQLSLRPGFRRLEKA